MFRSILVVSLLALLLSSSAAADQPSPTVTKAKRITKYFKNAHGAVVNGGVTPFAKVTNLGCQVRGLLGLQAGVSLAKVVDRGMVQRSRALYGGGTFGIQIGAGPEVSRMTYFGRRGTTGKEVLPTRESSVQSALCIFGERVADSKQGAKGLGWDIGTYSGFGVGGVVRKVISTGVAQKTLMLQRLEEGLKLSGEVNSALRAGQLNGIGAKVSRLEHLRSLVSSEKKALNAERSMIMPMDMTL